MVGEPRGTGSMDRGTGDARTLPAIAGVVFRGIQRGRVRIDDRTKPALARTCLAPLRKGVDKSI